MKLLSPCSKLSALCHYLENSSTIQLTQDQPLLKATVNKGLPKEKAVHLDHQKNTPLWTELTACSI